MATRRRGHYYAIESLAIEGYKSIRGRKEIATPPLTVIAGANSSGKSSIMQPLLMLKQTTDAPYDPGPLQLDGPNVSITKIEQALWKGGTATSRSSSFSIEVTISGRRTRAKFSKDSRGNLRVAEYEGFFLPEQQESIVLRDGMSHATLRKLVEPILKKAGFPPDLLRGNPQYSVERDRFLLYPQMRVESDKRQHMIYPFSFSSPDGLQDAVSRIIHLPALRGNPKRTYRTAAVEERYPGTFDTYTAGIISFWQNNKRDELQQLKRDLEDLGLTWKVEARQLDDTQVELLVGRLPHARQGGARDLVNIADVGFGVSQTLPVVVALLAASPGQMVYLEQPEIHLHPKAQLGFAKLITRAVGRGVRIVVETHSSLFIRAVQTLIAQDSLDKADVALHWFTRDFINGETQISTAELSDDGSFGEWPEDFDEVSMGAESAYLDAVMERSVTR